MTTRIDGRAPDELRPVHLATNVLDFAEGSCLVEFGRTRVLCAASVEDRQPPFLRNTQSGWVTAEYAMLPRATHTRSQREVERGRPGGRTQEIQRLIGRSLRGVVDLELLGPRTITLDCDVLQADGGTRTASITGAYVALRLAVRKLAAAGLVSEACILSPVAAVSVGIVGGVPMLDLCYEEDSTAEVDFNVVMTGEDAYVEVQGTAEGKPFSRAAMDALLDLARHGIGQLFAKQQEALAAAQPT
ncbi:MAG: ribonuclease PH [Dehalococcoidia bacterium]|uniref:Ribonuclease PH n=1 Tax=Tepidiforma bonchosmolovskayae TaxID=2601677 RepID=A0ABX6C5N2_9CHLR|nr:ribonuclease PH [Tepidiforma bonchosmolovskayae]MCL6644084.1 ribonuclease PH [Dehalococcoidia bacterium]QFG04134.1 ribonuclease PH [Tepidiforma bonchosmolovskayae]